MHRDITILLPSTPHKLGRSAAAGGKATAAAGAGASGLCNGGDSTGATGETASTEGVAI